LCISRDVPAVPPGGGGHAGHKTGSRCDVQQEDPMQVAHGETALS
jgi:hypothetical protein